MNFLNEFEDRIASVFGAAPQGYTEPFSFKKLAKRAAKEMDAETYEINGVLTAPALYTVLISSADDSLMRPLYRKITSETSMFLAAESDKRGYALVGQPLVRFMVDPSLRSGRFAVFAENVDYSALERLRAEEEAFMGGSVSVGGAAGHPGGKAQQRPEPMQPAPAPAPAPAPVKRPAPSRPAGDSAIPGIIPLPEIGPGGVAAPAEDGLDVIPLEFDDPYSADESASMNPIPATVRRVTPLVDEREGAVAAAQSAPAQKRTPACVLVDRSTGRAYTAKAPTAIIGRERSSADIVLQDPNVSRSHAELSFDGRSWHIADLRSTNGTKVNDINVDACILSDGDLITCGLVNLEFREN